MASRLRETATEHEIRQAGGEGKGVLIAPIAFVSEHVETLVELDDDYAKVASEIGCATEYQDTDTCLSVLSTRRRRLSSVSGKSASSPRASA